MAGIEHDAIIGMVGGAYRAAYEPALWPEVVDRIRLAFNGHHACLSRIGPHPTARDVSTQTGNLERRERAARTVELGANCLMGAFRSAPIGPVYRPEELCDAGALRKTRFWNEFMMPQDLSETLMTKIGANRHSYWFFAAHRGPHQSAFDEGDRRAMALVGEHLGKAIEIGRMLQFDRAAQAAKPGKRVGTIAVGRDSCILSVDAAAEAILSRPGCPLHRRGGYLVASGPLGYSLGHLVQSVCVLASQPGLSRAGSVLARAEAGHERTADLLVSIMPATWPDEAAFLAESAALLAIRELSPKLTAPFAAAAAKAFDLTDREAGLAAHLASGQSLRDAADSSGILVSTARSYLERIFRKTETHQQSELVALLRTIEPLVPSD